MRRHFLRQFKYVLGRLSNDAQLFGYFIHFYYYKKYQQSTSTYRRDAKEGEFVILTINAY